MPRRYNLRKKDRSVKWIEDDTLQEDPDYKEEDDSDYNPDEDKDIVLEDEEMDQESDEDESMDGDQAVILPKNAKISVQVHIHSTIDTKKGKPIEVDIIDEEEDEEEEDGFIKYLMDKYVDKPSKRRKVDDDVDMVAVLPLFNDEETYFADLSDTKKKRLNTKMKALSKLLSNGDVPYKFRVLELPILDTIKAVVIKKIDTLNSMSEDGNEVHKLRNWIEGFMRVPFGTVVPLPVKLADGPDKCAQFLHESRDILDKAVYGMAPAKTQIMQILAQWISNPSSVGNVIALKGPMGVGKTSFARNGISAVLKRPFQFISLGGASDASNFVGHSYTYEGSMWGRIADGLMHSRCMNPVFYFDEVDKISTTAHGEEIVSLLIHMTDRSQNSQFHDRYFAGIDFDLSQCLFVFSFNDESKIHPVLKDRMQVINCTGYEPKEKEHILKEYVLPQILERNNLKELTISPEAAKYMIEEYSKEEDGVRTLIRMMETVVTRINLLRIADEETAKSYKFYKKITLPCTVDVEFVKHILSDLQPKKREETWMAMYR
jgi:ATP-dependent Lon protease